MTNEEIKKRKSGLHKEYFPEWGWRGINCAGRRHPGICLAPWRIWEKSHAINGWWKLGVFAGEHKPYAWDIPAASLLCQTMVFMREQKLLCSYSGKFKMMTAMRAGKISYIRLIQNTPAQRWCQFDVEAIQLEKVIVQAGDTLSIENFGFYTNKYTTEGGLK